MLGAITGDIIGSVYEHNPIKSTNFQLFGPRSLFTDDSVCSVAIAEAREDVGDVGLIITQQMDAEAPVLCDQFTGTTGTVDADQQGRIVGGDRTHRRDGQAGLAGSTVGRHHGNG